MVFPRLTRTIPTRVGRTAGFVRIIAARADHPHAGGENALAVALNQIADGPSPRGWGEPRRWRSCQRSVRTIPTRVGRTCLLCRRHPETPDHPHAGGENPAARTAEGKWDGPSPRGWGEPAWAGPAAGVRRTIPTRVGRTAGKRRARSIPSDHPHAGGENDSVTRWGQEGGGPSPRGWGELREGVRVCRVGRTIPTRVGRTRIRSRAAGRAPDHPHAGGENTIFLPLQRTKGGPSPRGWGEPHAGCTGQYNRRTIPTRVGRTGMGG